jgi:hypothetical protein
MCFIFARLPFTPRHSLQSRAQMNEMKYTVKQLADRAGVSVRALLDPRLSEFFRDAIKFYCQGKK